MDSDDVRRQLVQGMDAELQATRETSWERRVCRFLLTHWGCSAGEVREIYTRGEQMTGSRVLLLAAMEEYLAMPCLLRTAVLQSGALSITLPACFSGRLISGELGQKFYGLRREFPESAERYESTALVVEYRHLKVKNTGSALVLHDNPPPADRLPDLEGGVMLLRGKKSQTLALEPLRLFLDRQFS